MTPEQHRRLNDILDKAIDNARAALRPVFDSGACHLPEEELSLLHEVDFELGALRMVHP